MRIALAIAIFWCINLTKLMLVFGRGGIGVWGKATRLECLQIAIDVKWSTIYGECKYAWSNENYRRPLSHVSVLCTVCNVAIPFLIPKKHSKIRTINSGSEFNYIDVSHRHKFHKEWRKSVLLSSTTTKYGDFLYLRNGDERKRIFHMMKYL